MLAALDLAAGKMYHRIQPRKRWREFLALLKALRARRPGENLYIAPDNFSPHKHPNVRAWAAANDVEPVFLPTYGSWLNWIESEFTALRCFALDGTDHRSHGEQNAAVNTYMCWHTGSSSQCWTRTSSSVLASEVAGLRPRRLTYTRACRTVTNAGTCRRPSSDTAYT